MSRVNRCCVLSSVFLAVILVVGVAALAVGPWEVVAWEHAGFSGAHMVWALEPGMRHKLVPELPGWFNDEISSLQVSAEVRVVVYRHNAFAGPSKIYSSDSEAVGGYWNDEISSLIVYPKALNKPLGVLLSDTAFNTVTGYEPTGQFFPLPEPLDQAETLYPTLGDYMNDEAEYVLIQGPTIEVELFEDADFSGWPTLTLPTSIYCSPAASYEHDGFPYYKLHGCTGDMDGRVSSLKVRWTGAEGRQETSTAPPIGPFTATIITPVPDISGHWHSAFGLDYKIVQDGAAFTWRVVQFEEVGEGTISGIEIGVEWQGANGTGHDTGAVILGDNGEVLRIEWTHGNVFYR